MKGFIQSATWVLLGCAVAACGDNQVTSGQPAAATLARVAQAVARQEERVSPADLAHWIIEGRKDFMLVDIRPADDYARGHIDGAGNVSITELVSPQHLQALPDDRRIIVYSNGSENAAKAAVMLRLAGYDAALLAGGYNFWSQQVLNPDIPETAADDEIPQLAEQRAIACYFIGGERAATPVKVHQSKPAFVPPVTTPASAAPPSPFADEGC
jgi:rhodanese-related sulfurtransferase